jgi:eukaryotic-like serine/threonine-protein kinase
MQTTQALDDDRIMNLVELALSRPREERASYVKSACGGDTDLLRAVWTYVQAEERMNGFLLDPLCPPPVIEHPFDPGEVVDDRFRVIREVARGGMGVVYEVTDEKLDRRVAIKCAKAGFNKRLPPEVRNAREISHPNVCRIFEMHTASTPRGQIDFITMEYLDGETLSARLRAGPMPEREARTIALQLCAGLAEAHRNQVIHGDLKTGNVILTTGASGKVRAVITDFGMARGLEASQRNLQTTEMGGTPDYMAPELWTGARASIASDIFALGVILFELVSGKKPLAKGETWEKRLTWTPPSVHPKWDRILGRCLAPDPAHRFADADQIAVAFGPPPSRKWFLAAGAAAILISASALVTYERAKAPKETVQLAVSPFESSNDIAPLADGVFRDTAAQLSRLKGNAHTRFRFVSAPGAPGATQVLHAILADENGKVALDAYLTDPRSRARGKEWKAEYAAGEMRYIPAALTGLVTEALHLPPAIAVPQVNAAAREDYSTGLGYTRQNSTIDAALPLLERAVTADPDSPLTHAGLAEAQWFKYFLTKDQIWRDRAVESVRQAENRNPDLAAVHRIAGLLMANDGRYEQATEEYLRAIELDPKNSDAWRRLGKVYQTTNQAALTLAAFRKAVELAPNYFKPYQDLGAFYYSSANYPEAIRQFKKMAALAPDEPDAHLALGDAFLSLGQYVPAELENRRALELAETPAILNNLGVALLYQGRDRDAIPYFARALELSPDQSSFWWMNVATAYRRVKQVSKSRSANQRGLEIAEKEESLDPRDGKVKSRLAYFCAQLGDHHRAGFDLSQALQLSPNDADTRWTAAVTYEALHQRDNTIKVASDSPCGVLTDLSRWPDVADLRSDPRFLQLLSKCSGN